MRNGAFARQELFGVQSMRGAEGAWTAETEAKSVEGVGGRSLSRGKCGRAWKARRVVVRNKLVQGPG